MCSIRCSIGYGIVGDGEGDSQNIEMMVMGRVTLEDMGIGDVSPKEGRVSSGDGFGISM